MRNELVRKLNDWGIRDYLPGTISTEELADYIIANGWTKQPQNVGAETLVCPYCNGEQNPFNIKPSPYTDREWRLYDCEHCKQSFGYRQEVKRTYHTTKLIRTD